jgi:hypothetical protein
LLASLAACSGEIHRSASPDPAADPDASPPVGDADASVRADSGPPRPPEDAAMPVPEDAHVPPLEPLAGMLAADLAIARVDLYQSVRVPIARDGTGADRDGLPVVAGREALVRVHAEALAGWRPRAITAVVEVDRAGTVERFTDTRIPELPSDDRDPESLFAVHVPKDVIEPGAFFRVRLEADDGVADAAEATYPRDGTFTDLDATILAPVVVVLVPFRYDTDGSGRLPDTSPEQLERYHDELTSRFPFAEVDLRVHDVVPWTRSTRSTGSVDWGAVNSSLIAMRDDEGAHDAEYWYGLLAPHTSRSAYCRSTTRCVTGQSYVATLRGSRVGSGVGFGDVASVRTFAHELGHMHGRYHSPCGTSGTDGDYPYAGGKIGFWGWDRRDGSFHDPDVATDMLGYCDRQWISDYNYLAIHDRHVALRSTLAAHVPSPPVLRRFVTLDDTGAASFEPPVSLRALPGELTPALYLDVLGRPLATVTIGTLVPAHGTDRVFVVPANAPPGARALRADGAAIPLP